MRRVTGWEDTWTRAAKAGVLVLAVALPVSTLVTAGFYPGGYFDLVEPRSKVVAAWVLAGVFVPLHLGHVRHGLRDEVPPHGGMTFAVMAAVMVAGEIVVGHQWTLMFASLVASALLVFRPPWSLAWAIGVTLATFPLGTGVFGEGGWYVAVVSASRSATLFSLVWLVAGVHRLGVARRILAERATARERARVDADLLCSVRVDLESIEAQARRAHTAYADGDNETAHQALTQVTADARAALAAARSVVANMRRASSREDLQAAAKLLAVPDSGP